MRGRAALVAAAATLMALPAAPAPAGDVFTEAQEAAFSLRFRATVSVQWADGEGVHDAVVTMRSDQGSVEAGGLQWSSTALLQPPGPDPKYELRTGPGEPVAGRSTSAVDVLVNGKQRERLAVDRETRLILERVQLDAVGRPVRVVRIESLTLLPPDDVVVPAPALTFTELPSRYRAPAQLAAGYQRVAAYRRGAVTQVVYSDGLHGLSVFLQAGRLDTRSLPGRVMWVALGRRTAAVHSWPGGETVLWEAGGVVYTAVGDGPVEDVVSAAASMPSPAPPSIGTRARQRARAVVETLLGRSA